MNKMIIILSILCGPLVQSQQQIIGHAITHQEQQEIALDDLLIDLKLIARNSDTIPNCGNYLLANYGHTNEFQNICACFDLMRKEFQGKISANEKPSEFHDLIGDLKTVLVAKNNSMVEFMQFYKHARCMYIKYSNRPEFIVLANLFDTINSEDQLDENKQQVNNKLKKFKLIALGALTSFAEGAVNALIE